jgi:hypothetical protein
VRAMKLEVEEDPSGDGAQELRWELTEDGKVLNSGTWRVPDNLEEEDASESWLNLMRVLLDR